MNRRAFLLAMLVVAFSVPVLHANEVDEPLAAMEDLEAVEVFNGATFKNSELTKAHKAIVEGLKLPKASYQIDGSTLRIGTHVADAPQGKVLDIEFRSDCPNNSQFHVTPAPILTQKWEGRIKAALFAWTKHRHDDFSAKLKVVNVSALNDRKFNYDVQLNLSRVSAVPRE